MGLEDEVDVTDDIGTADAILACSYEMKQNPWIRGVAKFHHLPIFVMKVSSYVILSCVYMTIGGLYHLDTWYCFAVKHNGTNGQGSSYDSRKGNDWLFVKTTI